MKRLTKELSREIRVYHWGNYGKRLLRRVSPDHSFWREKVLKEVGSAFYYHNHNNDMLGSALYSTFDPGMSRSYGDSVVEFVIKKGTRFLDIRSGHRYAFEIRRSTRDKLVEICPSVWPIEDSGPYFAAGEEYVSVWMQDLVRDKTCRKYFNQAIYELEAQFISYQWLRPGEGSFSYAGCNEDERSGFVIMGKLVSNPAKTNEIRVDFSDIKSNGFIRRFKLPRKKDSQINRLIKKDDEWKRYFFIDQYLRLTSGEAMWSQLDNIENPDYDGFIQKVRESRFNCDGEYFEDALIQY